MTTENSPEETQNQTTVESAAAPETPAKVTPEPKKKKAPVVNSLGNLAKRQDYDALLIELRELEKPEHADNREKFYKRKDGDLPSEMDKLLVALIANMAPKPEEDVSQWGPSSASSTALNAGSMATVGVPIAPPMGSMPKPKTTWNEVVFEDLVIAKDDIPLAGLECIDFLLEKGVNPNVCTMAGLNAVMMACTLNNEEPLLKLLNNPFKGLTDTWEEYDYKGKLNHADVLGNDALAYAVLTGNFYMADYLINELGFDINKKYFRMQSQTLLHIVSERFNYKTTAHPLKGFLYDFEENSNENKIAYLLERKADPSISDMNGRVPEECIPAVTEELKEELGEISTQESECWDRCFAKLGEKRKEFEAVKKEKRKYSF